MKVININIRINDLSQTGVDWNDEDEVHLVINDLRRELRRVCWHNISVGQDSIMIDAVVANLVE